MYYKMVVRYVYEWRKVYRVGIAGVRMIHTACFYIQLERVTQDHN